MVTQAAELELFIASPGDLPEERALVRETADRVVQMCGVHLGIRVRVTGWEGVRPDLGRPQDLINPLVDSCDIFIGLLHRRWGSDSGEADSGFGEEFGRVVARRSTGQVPAVALFFRRLSDAEAADAGPQLTRVLEFRDQIRRDHVALYREFDSAPDLERQLVEYLVGVLTARATAPGGPTFELQGPVQPAPNDPAATADEDLDAGLDSAQEQVASVLDSYERAVRGDATDSLDGDRLLLFALSLRDGGPIPTHAANRLYRRRESLSLLALEGQQWLNTIAADFTSEDASDLVIPGWFFLVGHDISPRCADLAQGDEASAARGAVRILTIMRARPDRLWPTPGGPAGDQESAIERWVSLLSESWRSSDAMTYLAELASADDLPMLRGLVDATEGQAFSSDVRALVGTLEGNYEELIDVIRRDRYSSRTWARHVLLSRLGNASDDQLAQLFESPSTSSADLLDAAIGELVGRGAISVELALRVLTGSSDTQAERVLNYVQEHPELARPLLEGVDPAKGTFRASAKPRLMAISLPTDELRRTVTSVLSPDIWEALLWSDAASMVEEARQFLALPKDEWVARAMRELPSLTDQGDLVGYLHGRRVRAAVLLLARLPAETRLPSDADLVRQAVVRSDRLFKADIAESLIALGDETDAALLLDAVKSADIEQGGRLTSSALVLGGVGAAAELASGTDTTLAEAALRFMSQHGASSDELKPYLYHQNAQLRAVAIESICRLSTREELAQLLEDYADTRPHFYNVVAWVDRFLYAPGPLAGLPSETP